MEDESEKKLETQESEEHVVNSDTIVEELADEYSQYLKIDSDVEVIYFFVFFHFHLPFSLITLKCSFQGVFGSVYSVFFHNV
jgi:hypothetical protein